jgi:hypothetical protein|tara:strand:- start:150 stop:614 length:465 start_codon:yes stop_codon:yes gene_type:complete
VDLGDIPQWAQIVDGAIGAVTVILFLIVSISWLTGSADSEVKVEDKNAGRSAVAAQLSLSVTAASILLAASFVVIQMGRSSDTEIAEGAVAQVLLSSIAFAASIAIAVWNSSLIVPLSKSLDVSDNTGTGIISGASLFLLVAGAGFFLVAIFLI